MSRSLTVEEIVARHQAAAARQAAMVRSIIATGTLTLSFEAPGFPAPITISSETTIYTSDGVTEIEQRAIRVNGIEFRGRAVPRLPIIEPERVASPPLAITLTDIYRYRLAGRETVGGTLCYVVAFEPDPARGAEGTPLFRGRAWIAADSFAMLKVSATQTGLRGPIVASEQADEFRQARPGIWAAGALRRATDVRRSGAPDADPPRAGDCRQRDQSAGLRRPPPGGVQLRLGDAAGHAAKATATCRRIQPAAPATPEIAGRADRVRTLAAGVIIDPNISVPLPFAGISYVDFNLLDTGTQVNAFFGGTYGQLAFSVPSIRRQPVASSPAADSALRRRTTIDRSSTVESNTRKTSGSGRHRLRSGCCDR